MKKLVAIVGATALAIGLMAGTAVPAKTKAAPRKTTAKVGLHDYYYDPTSLNIAKGGKVKWTWMGFDNHNVTLYKAPNGVKKGDFRSTTAGHGTTFTRTFTKPGTYQFHCTIHPTQMYMTLKVTN